MGHYTGIKGLGQFRQYVDDDVQQCHFVHEYEDKLTDMNTNGLKKFI
jgi:hypothetical protein